MHLYFFSSLLIFAQIAFSTLKIGKNKVIGIELVENNVSYMEFNTDPPCHILKNFLTSSRD